MSFFLLFFHHFYHLGAEVLNSKLPGICELSKTFAHVDPIYEPIPVVPTCHYMMGGTPTNISGQAFTRINDEDHLIPGLFSAGEAACALGAAAPRLGHEVPVLAHRQGV